MTNTKKRIGITVPIHLYKELKSESEYTGLTINGLICQILWKWLKTEFSENKTI